MTDFVFLRSLASAAVLSGLVLVAEAATAATMTFATLDSLDQPVSTYSEDGITVVGGLSGDQFLNIYPAFMDQDIYMVDGGADAPSLLTFTMAGRFDAISFEIRRSLRNAYDLYWDGSDFDYSNYVLSEFSDLLVEGFRETDRVADILIDSLSILVDEGGTVSLDSRFTNLTRLVVTLKLPAGFPDLYLFDSPDQPGTYSVCTDNPCAQLNLDNFSLTPVAPVPVPASALLAGSGLAALLIVARRRRSAG